MDDTEVFTEKNSQIEVEDTEDGGAVVYIGQTEPEAAKHFANIVDTVDDTELKEIVTDLIEKIAIDKEARAKRDKLYEEGIRRTGLGDDAPGGADFSGATKVVHPLLVEACVDFSARAMKEMFPPGGPVRSKIYGKINKDKTEKAQRKTEFMNWQLTEQIMEFRSELEQLTTQLPLGGGQYLKLMRSERRKRAVCEFVAIDDMLLPFAATNFYTAERKTHVQYVTKSEFARRITSGMYVDVDINLEIAPEDPEPTDSEIANDKVEGREEPAFNVDGLRTIFETCINLDFGEGEFPYIITIDKSTEKALSLYRNWDEADEDKNELYWIVEFPFIPWRGAYPIGLTHMIGSLSGAATGALRALLDSAHIQNIPTAIKLKGGPNGQNISLDPTEIAEIDGGVGADDIRKLVMPIPFNPPSQVLFSLLGFLVQTGKGVVQSTFEQLGSQDPNQPVGTTMALIEQGMVVFSSIHSRMHSSMAMVLRILHRINSAYLTEEEIKKFLGEDAGVVPEDFDGPVDIIPVSDPHIFSEVQRFAQAQAIMQRVQIVPELYDKRKVEERFLAQMKISDDILIEKAVAKDMDPISENVAATMGKQIFALPAQQHTHHIDIHLAFCESPVFGKNPVIGKTCLPAMVTHIRDHMIQYYMKSTHKLTGSMKEQSTEDQVAAVLQAQNKLDGMFDEVGRILLEIDATAAKLNPPQTPPDNSLQVAEMVSRDKQASIAQKDKQAAMDRQVEQEKTQSKSQTDGQKHNAQMQLEQEKLADKKEGRVHDLTKEQFTQEQSNARNTEDNITKTQINESDNVTAKELAAMETLTGEKVAVSTGTGINPNPRP